MEIIKNDWRSCLNSSHLQSLLRVKMEDPCLVTFLTPFGRNLLNFGGMKSEEERVQGSINIQNSMGKMKELDFYKFVHMRSSSDECDKELIWNDVD